MDDPNITMAEYIQLEDEKARRRGQEFIRKLLHMVRSVSSDFENKFTAIVYHDALTSELEVSSDFENEFLAIMYNDTLTFKP
nr:hypothetical protein [Tanacetum cinerariifolium]